ncbi:MAG TPA: GNAT family N-acetyltransferase, partial [Candidatus Binataceae bacterium]|nr:GNAT family N-acetyltransferase [Candidatus Binataceae bacterium]
MKVSLTNESAGAFFEASSAVATPIETATGAVRDGLSVMPWEAGVALWRSILNRFGGATFYHCEPWIEAVREAYSMRLELATLHRGGELRAAGVFARTKRLFSPRLLALPFSDCAEPLAIDEGARADFMRELVSSNPGVSIEVRGIAGPPPWRNVDCFEHWTLDLRRPYSEISAKFNRTVKAGVKRAVRDHLQIDRGTGIDYLTRFYNLQLETRRRLGVPPQPFRFFATVHEKFARGDNCEIWFARQAGRDHAGLVMLRGGDVVCYKWGARIENGHPGANHFLVASVIEAYAEKAASMDLGRCDIRNQGLVRSKIDLGCESRALPYAFFPKVQRNVSSEVLSGPARMVSAVWKRLPLPMTRVLGEA